MLAVWTFTGHRWGRHYEPSCNEYMLNPIKINPIMIKNNRIMANCKYADSIKSGVFE